MDSLILNLKMADLIYSEPRAANGFRDFNWFPLAPVTVANSFKQGKHVRARLEGNFLYVDGRLQDLRSPAGNITQDKFRLNHALIAYSNGKNITDLSLPNSDTKLTLPNSNLEKAIELLPLFIPFDHMIITIDHVPVRLAYDPEISGNSPYRTSEIRTEPTSLRLAL